MQLCRDSPIRDRNLCLRSIGMKDACQSSKVCENGRFDTAAIVIEDLHSVYRV